MDREEKYKYLSIILLKRLILLENNLINLQNELEQNENNYMVKVCIETKDIIPFLDIIKLLNADDKIFDIFNNMLKSEHKNLEKEIKHFFNLYIS